MIQVLLNKKVLDFETNYSYYDFKEETGEFLQPANSKKAVETNLYLFQNPRIVPEGVWYEMTVVRRKESFETITVDLTENEESFRKYFKDIAKDFRKLNIKILNYDSVHLIHAYMYIEDFDTGLTKIKFTNFNEQYLVDDEVIEHGVHDFSILMAYLREEDENANMLKFYRTIGDFRYVNDRFYISADTMQDHFDDIFHESEDISEILRGQKMRELVIDYFKSRVSEYDKSGEFYRNSKFNYINIDKIQDFILTLPDELIKQVLRITEQTSQNLHLRRLLAEDTIDWKQIKEYQLRTSDIDLFLKYRDLVEIDNDALEKLIAKFMNDPEREVKVVQHAWSLCGCFQWYISERLKTCTREDHLRSVLDEVKQSGEIVKADAIRSLFNYRYMNLTKEDYDIFHQFFEVRDVSAARFLIKIALISGQEPDEIRGLIYKLETDDLISRYNPGLFDYYQNYSFKEGLKWIDEFQAMEKAKKFEQEKARTRKAAKLSKFIKDTKDLVVVVKSVYDPRNKDYVAINSRHGEDLGILLSDEKNLFLIEGRKYDYIINVERVRKLRNGILHLDVFEGDAGTLVGRDGSNIRYILERLNQLGCNLSNIKIYSHNEVDLFYSVS
ncbi:MAG: hypothetical protein HXL13_00665 [Candidatus Nanosynbacter sp.]|nr:hypothetical protein [Candidatus Nanosynbacter sp.]